MFRILLVSLTAVLLSVSPADALGKRVMRQFSPVEKVAHADLVVAGKVTGFAKDAMLSQYAGDPSKVAHRVAIVKIEKGFLGAGKMTEVKVAFVPPPKPQPNAPVRPVRGGFQAIDLKEGEEATFFLTKHIGGDYYTTTPMLAPIGAKDPGAKAANDVVASAAAAIADPKTALTAKKPEDRYLAALAIITRYRSAPQDGRETTTVQVPAEESKLLLRGLTEGDWSKYDPNVVNGAQVFYSLALTDKDGWVPPVIANNPGGQQIDFNAAMRDAFWQWIQGPGKNYRINRIVPKAKP